MNARGFTLIETILAIILMSILGFMAAQLISASLRGSAESARQVTDLTNAATAMEQLIAALNTESSLDAEAGLRIKDVESAQKKLTVDATVNAVPFPYASSGNAILVTVSSGAVELTRVF